ncbi:RagB/SusD family nutrient uptake outer membrane protein [Pedobacter sp. MW01-1-1]|uniref:RagB/SusD family nutrient uptake outer membrane protein n=1 Tax=Pedobacter sp. MW01-1-1 TaxID=3383027 RepID=UPI003FEF6C71
MKKYKIILIAVASSLSLFSLSCKKFLEVRPKTQVEESDQFQNKQGFVDVLMGTYQIMAKPAGYGREFTFGTMDIIAQRYENRSTANTLYNRLATHSYLQTDVRSILDGMFINSYSAIAQANYVLKHVDNGVLSASDANIVKGEALGLRGFLHFDLIRFYSDNFDGGTNASAPSIAYLKEFTVGTNPRLNLGRALELCEADLKAAEQLLAQTPDATGTFDRSGANSNVFLQFRHNRFNYWAVKATLARLYQLKGDKANAFKYATEVIASAKFNFVNQTSLVVNPTDAAADLTFFQEHVFSLYVSNLKVTADNVFKNAEAAGESSDLWSTRAALAVVYPTTFPDDVRSNLAPKNIWNEVSPTIVYSKKYWSDATSGVRQKMIPLIKLAEMYYIAAEAAPNLTTSGTYFNTVRNARLIPGSITFTTAAQLDGELLLEYRKEFYAEGQLWPYYKRRNLATIWNGGTATGTIAMTKAKYIFPLPDTEIEFGSTNF